ncbi:DUF1217 domain-containing protein [Paracoccus sp. CPCC 101403]|uniref:DUF1217 domain-containing protein n=1 Tax=Paracoccus broussonetiae TaxID=3075834 RepID=A0ABU3EB36_9RHOB|nr:DUF1217 domain-containing protein [Paracoccus sp. CPCC 101403]MDT1061440.1 DUF1217 domain-containing protein [Paracoccus sp. CPCC 101403]
MTYQVQVGQGGYTGWKLLERTAETQRATLARDPEILRSRTYFAEKLPQVKTADQMVSDYRLLNVALRAFGLEADMKNRLFIKKVLEADPNDSNSIVNRLSDKRYLNLNKALGMGQAGGATESAADVGAILDLYVSKTFERNIGDRYQEIELALNARRELPALAESGSSDNTKWYQILGSQPLRKIFEGAFGLGSTFGRLPVDRQVDEMKTRLEKMTGSSSVAQFAEPEKLENLLKTYLLRSSINSGASATPYSAALTILRGY